MANVKAFRGYRYNCGKIGDMSTVVVPTQYNIDDDEKQKMYDLNEYNAIRIFDGMEFENDTDEVNKYTRARDYLQNWIQNDVLVQDDEDAIYLYEETITLHGNEYQNLTFVTLLELEELGAGNIKTCEEIHEISRKDRYDLLAATGSDMSMITCLYIERGKDLLNLMNDLKESEPDMEFESWDGIHQRLWKITDADTIQTVINGFEDLPLYITDGQTRYETCIRYRNYMRANNPNHTGKEPYNYTLVSLINTNSDGIDVMPMHRKVKLPRGFSEEFFVAAIQDHFKIEKIIVDAQDDSITETMKKQIRSKKPSETRFGLYFEGSYFYRITLVDTDYIKKELLPEMSKAYCGLDTVVLRKLILNDIFGINDDYDDLVSASISTTECYNAVKNGEADVMFAMNPVRLEQIESVTAAGEKMPFQSINIFPKPSVGVVINMK